MPNNKKYMFVSDIHGNIEIFDECLNIFNRENADKLIFLGDTSASSYDDENNKYIAKKLNDLSNKVELIRGNCDGSNFESLLDNAIFDNDTLYINEKFVTITHGHLNGNYFLPQYCGEIYIQGHTHVPLLEKRGSYILANPGSPSRPRGFSLKCYLIVDKNGIYLKNFSGEIINQILF